MKQLWAWSLLKFNRWFTSAAGILHTMMLVLFVVLAEQLHLLRDTHGFWLLYWLTVYSAVTQPALAYVAKQSGDNEDKILRHIEQVLLTTTEIHKHVSGESGDFKPGETPQ